MAEAILSDSSIDIRRNIASFGSTSLVHFPQSIQNNCGSFIQALRALPREFFHIDQLRTDANGFRAFKRSVVQSYTTFNDAYKRCRVFGTITNASPLKDLRQDNQYYFGITKSMPYSIPAHLLNVKKVKFGDDPNDLIEFCKFLALSKRHIKKLLVTCRSVLALLNQHRFTGDTQRAVSEARRRNLNPSSSIFDYVGDERRALNMNLQEIETRFNAINIPKLEADLNHDEAILATVLVPDANDALLAAT